MSLDQNLFTLFFTANKDNPAVIDLVDPAGNIHYRKQRLPGTEYKAEVYDPASESLLITATAPSPTTKVKVLELYNPTKVVELKYTGTLSFRWSFTWEQHEFEWKREECYMLRKPDPPVLVAITKEPSGRLKTTSVQILDYNLNRFDIDDRKGLEIVMLTALLTFQDVNETYHVQRSKSEEVSTAASTAISRSLSDRPPPPPPKPAPKTGVERVAEIQALKGEFNEITVEEEGSIYDYAQYCWKLLQDDAMLFITVKSSDPEQVTKVLRVVEEAKRIRHKAGVSDEEELHQYVLYDTIKPKGPKRINLDDNKGKSKYIPPNSLLIHLSKIPMPELQPKATPTEKPKKDTNSSSHTPSLSTSSKLELPNNLASGRSPSPNPRSNVPTATPPKRPSSSSGRLGSSSSSVPSMSGKRSPPRTGNNSKSSSPFPPWQQSVSPSPSPKSTTVVSGLFDKLTHLR